MPSRIQVVSYSELDTYRQCPLKHHLSYQLRYQDQPREGSARDRGTLFHAVLEAHYTAIRAQQELAVELRRDWETWDVDAAAAQAQARVSELLTDPSGDPRSETHELVGWMYAGHLQRWGFDPNWRILAVEVRDVFPLYAYNRAGVLAPSRFHLKTKIDLVVQDYAMGGRVWVVDHKSGKDLPGNKELDLDDQFGLYTLMLRRRGRKVFGQIYNAARTQRNKTGVQTLESRMERYRLYRDDPELLKLEAEAVETFQAAYRKRTGEPPSSPNPGECKWKCDFLEVHLQARKQGRTAAEVADQFGFVQNFERH